MLGGSSGINFMAYIRPQAEDIDLWEKLGNTGWSWEELRPYFLKTERFYDRNVRTGNEEINGGTTSHGGSGPIITSLPSGKPQIEERIIAALPQLRRPSNPLRVCAI